MRRTVWPVVVWGKLKEFAENPRHWRKRAAGPKWARDLTGYAGLRALIAQETTRRARRSGLGESFRCILADDEL